MSEDDNSVRRAFFGAPLWAGLLTGAVAGASLAGILVHRPAVRSPNVELAIDQYGKIHPLVKPHDIVKWWVLGLGAHSGEKIAARDIVFTGPDPCTPMGTLGVPLQDGTCEIAANVVGTWHPYKCSDRACDPTMPIGSWTEAQDKHGDVRVGVSPPGPLVRAVIACGTDGSYKVDYKQTDYGSDPGPHPDPDHTLTVDVGSSIVWDDQAGLSPKWTVQVDALATGKAVCSGDPQVFTDEGQGSAGPCQVMPSAVGPVQYHLGNLHTTAGACRNALPTVANTTFMVNPIAAVNGSAGGGGSASQR